MKVWTQRFNIYLTLLALLCPVSGCLTNKPHGPTSALRIHVEASPNYLGTSETISVLRADPVVISIAKDPILTEANIIAAELIEAPGGFAVEVRFDESGTQILEEYTAANTGLHLAIFGQWGDKISAARWLSAPLITHRIGNGVLAFTPDMSHDEAVQLVTGLKNVAEFNKKQSQ